MSNEAANLERWVRSVECKLRGSILTRDQAERILRDVHINQATIPDLDESI